MSMLYDLGKVSKYNVGRDGTLAVGNFILMKKKHISLQKSDKDKKCVPNFLFIRLFTFRIYEIYKEKYWFHSKNFENFVLLKTAIKKFPFVTRRRRCGQIFFTRLQPTP
jgi:hypothetical protein